MNLVEPEGALRTPTEQVPPGFQLNHRVMNLNPDCPPSPLPWSPSRPQPL